MNRWLLLLLLAGSEAPLGSPDFRASAERPFGWRGDGSGRYPAATPVLEWAPAKNVRWSVEVGSGYASPILAGAVVIVMSEPNLLIGLDRADGRVLWKVETVPADLADPDARAAAAEYKPKDTGLAAATPVTDGTCVYAVFANGIVRAVGLDGRPKWTVFIEARQNTAYGRSASPVLVGGRLIVHLTHLYALDPVSGRRLWVNDASRCVYGTPVPLRSGGLDLLVTPAGDVVRADDGKTVNSQIGNSAHASPVVLDGTVYYGEKDVRALRLGAAFKDESVWNSELTGEIFGSPLAHDGLLFTVTDKGHLYVFNTAAKGATEPVVAARELFGDEAGADLVYSSLTLAGRHLFLQANDGQTLVLEATKEAKVVARNKLGAGSGAAPVFSGRDLFLRDGSKLVRITDEREVERGSK